MKIHLTAIHFDADQKLIDYIEKKAFEKNTYELLIKNAYENKD